jgi:hypothetical protein
VEAQATRVSEDAIAPAPAPDNGETPQVADEHRQMPPLTLGPESFDNDGNWTGPTREFWSEEDFRHEGEEPLDDADPLPPEQDDDRL